MGPSAPPPTPPPAAANARRGPSAVRSIADALALLAVAVMTFHAFEVEGYVISSGSMAPGLFGFHKRVECPRCDHAFARGVAFDPGEGDGVNAGEADDFPDAKPVTFAACPNCGQPEIDVTAAPENQGDQLLVLKHAFAWRTPRRWEVVVFRHPDDARQAYVKRVAGLPGERVRVRDGDVYADGELCRKPLETQRAVRIAVHDPAEVPAGDWRDRWSGGGWVRVETDDDGDPGVRFDAPAAFAARHDSPAEPARGWRKLRYRHYLAAGGSHVASVTIDPLPPHFSWDRPRLPRPYRFDPATGELQCRGVLSEADAARLRFVSRHPRWRAAVAELAEASRFAPVTDLYGYNNAPGLHDAGRVRDFQLALAADLSTDPRAALGLELTDGARTFLLVADRPAGTVSLHELADDGTPGVPLRSAPLPAACDNGPIDFEFSLFDRQVAAAAGGAELFAPIPYDRPADAPPPGDSPATVGARGAVSVTDLILYRDVHYTRGRAVHGVEDDYELGPGELFVLGDNSPVSLDSRGWEDGAIPERLLVGKPFVVHLPSRPGTLSWGAGQTTVRIPDPSRVRFVR